MLKFIILISLLWGLPCFGQSDFSPTPFTTSNSKLEIQLEKRLEEQLDGINDLKGKEAKIVKSSFKSRHDLLKGMLEDGYFLFDSVIYPHTNNVLQKVLEGNPEIDPNTMLLISRSVEVNAFTTGDGFIVVNLGLLANLKDDNELAFILSHELSHQVKDHSNQSIRQRASTYTDPARQAEIRQVLKSKYRVASQLEDLLIPGMVAQMAHSRERELECDSLGVVFMRNAGFNPQGAIGVLKVLHASNEPDTLLFVPWKEFLLSTNCEINSIKEEVDLQSSLGTFADKDSLLREKLKSHPDCILRMDRLENSFQIEGENIDQDLLDYLKVKEISQLELLESSIFWNNLGYALYYSISLSYLHPEWEYPKHTAGYLMAEIAHFKKQRKLGIYVDHHSPDYPENYNQYLNAIWELKKDDCACISYEISRSGGGEDSENKLAAMVISAFVKGDLEESGTLAKEFMEKYPEGNRKSVVGQFVKSK